MRHTARGGTCAFRETMTDSELIARLKELERASRPLSPGTGRRRAARAAVAAAGDRFLRSIEHQPAFDGRQGDGLLDAPIGEQGLDLRELIPLVEQQVMYSGVNAAGPGCLGYIPGGGIYYSALGDYLAAVSNRFSGVFFGSPGAVRAENMVLRWVADEIGFPAESVGNLTSGGSIANLIAVVSAREAHGIVAAAVSSQVVYLTSQTHHSLDKALRIAGLGEVVVRQIPVDDAFRMQADRLAQQVAADRAAGLHPWLILGAAGTTDTGAVDPLDRLADIATQERCWFHVDGAYGGFFALTEAGKRVLQGIGRADSVVLDPHKSLFLPYGSGLVLIRDPEPMRRAHRGDAAYMQDLTDDPTEVSPADVSPELSRPFRGLRIWLPLKLLGVKPFRAALDEKLLLAQYFYARVAELGFEVGPPPDLSLVTFRWVPAGLSLDEVNALNRRIIEWLRDDGRIFLSSTMIDGRYTLRMVILSFRTHRRTVDVALRALADAVRALQPV
ncbi:MAG: pyridoxal phosphate-dependent decarboxylase family protein [Gemmatimonadales bacterium]